MEEPLVEALQFEAISLIKSCADITLLDFIHKLLVELIE